MCHRLHLRSRHQSNQPRTEADTGDAWFGLGNALLFLGKYKEARQAFEEFVRMVVPELQRRGLFRREYAGTTLREHLGIARPQSR